MATDNQIINAEILLNTKFDVQYKSFIQNFGGAYVGVAIYGFENSSSLGTETVIDLTLNARKLSNSLGLFDEVNQCIVISDDGSGNPIAIETNGNIVLFDYDIEEKQLLALTFEQLIEDNFCEW